MLKAIDAALYILNVYSIQLPPGECYPTEPFGEIGPDQFVTETIKALEEARKIEVDHQTYITFLEDSIEFWKYMARDKTDI